MQMFVNKTGKKSLLHLMNNEIISSDFLHYPTLTHRLHKTSKYSIKTLLKEILLITYLIFRTLQPLNFKKWWTRLFPRVYKSAILFLTENSSSFPLELSNQTSMIFWWIFTINSWNLHKNKIEIQSLSDKSKVSTMNLLKYCTTFQR